MQYVIQVISDWVNSDNLIVAITQTYAHEL